MHTSFIDKKTARLFIFPYMVHPSKPDICIIKGKVYSQDGHQLLPFICEYLRSCRFDYCI